jgi:hypothetical protein
MESANRGERRYSLDEKSAGLQKGNRPGYFEGRTAQAGGVRNDGKECPVLYSNRPADYQGGTGFPAMPKSISQTSPRRGVAILFLKGFEQGGGGSADFLVFQGSGIERQRTAQHLLRKGALLFHREMFEGVEQCFGISAHEHIIPAQRRAKKKSFRRLQVTLSPFAFPLRTALIPQGGRRGSG